jgi:pyruvate formate lyase activating enzyme
MLIGGLQKVSLIDYPGLVCCVIFTQGCNFKCTYCHNPELVDPKLYSKPIPIEEIFSFLNKRRKLLDGVCICGGEPLIHQDLFEFIKKIKAMGYLIKIDTNGSFPKRLQKLIESSLIDYIAMDIKAPLAKYKFITNSEIKSEEIKESIKLIMNSNIKYEFRTTILKSQLTKEDLIDIAKLIKNANLYVLQRFYPKNKLLSSHIQHDTYQDYEFNYFKQLLEGSYVRKCIIK